MSVVLSGGGFSRKLTRWGLGRGLLRCSYRAQYRLWCRLLLSDQWLCSLLPVCATPDAACALGVSVLCRQSDCGRVEFPAVLFAAAFSRAMDSPRGSRVSGRDGPCWGETRRLAARLTATNMCMFTHKFIRSAHKQAQQLQKVLTWAQLIKSDCSFFFLIPVKKCKKKKKKTRTSEQLHRFK